MRLTPRARQKVDNVKKYTNDLRITLFHNATAYGYSILITGTYIILDNAQGKTSNTDVFLGALGAILSFALVEAVSTGGFRERGKGDTPQSVMLGSAMSFFSVGLGLGVAVVATTWLSGWVSWLLAPLLATTAYILVETIELTMAKRIRNEEYPRLDG